MSSEKLIGQDQNQNMSSKFVNCPGVELFYLGINVLSILTQNDYCKVIDLDQNQINIKTWTA